MSIFFSATTNWFYDSTEYEESRLPPDVVEISEDCRQELIAGQVTGKVIVGDTSGYPTLIEQTMVWQTGAELSAKLDASIADIYLNWTRFAAEYEFREKAALLYKAANYVGEVSVWIAAFATAANLSTRKACDLILAQATGLRNAQEMLGALRMRKYEILPLTEQAALDKYNEISTIIQHEVAQIV